MGKQRRGRDGSAGQGGGVWAPQAGHAGKGNRAAKVYAGARPAQRGLDRGNAIIVVIARQGGRESREPREPREIDRWQGPMNWPADWEQLPVVFTAERVGQRWSFSDARAAEVCLDSDMPVGCGIAIEPWADQLGATELTIRIVANPGAAKPDAGTRGLGTQGQGTGDSTRGEASRSVDRAFHDMFADMLGHPRAEHGDAGGLGVQGTGSAQGVSGERAAGGRGHDAGKADGEPEGSRTPSWTTRAGAAVDNEWGGRTPDLEHGKSGGSAGGRQGGEGHLLGLWNGPIDIASQVAIAVNAAIVLLDADMSDLGKKLLGKVVRGLGGKQLRKELAAELDQVVDARMPELGELEGSVAKRSANSPSLIVDRQLAADAGYQAMSKAEKEAVLARARERLEREAHARARAYFAEQAERSEALVQELSGKADELAAHERDLAAANARAYRELEQAAADSSRLENSELTRVAGAADHAGSSAAGAQAAARGLKREARVAELVGGRVSREPIKTRFGASDVDVIGPAGELIAVGGPSKAKNLSKLGSHLKVLEEAAAQRGVAAKAAFERGTPQSAIDLAVKKLGRDNVIIFDP